MKPEQCMIQGDISEHVLFIACSIYIPVETGQFVHHTWHPAYLCEHKTKVQPFCTDVEITMYDC